MLSQLRNSLPLITSNSRGTPLKHSQTRKGQHRNQDVYPEEHEQKFLIHCKSSQTTNSFHILHNFFYIISTFSMIILTLKTVIVFHSQTNIKATRINATPSISRLHIDSMRVFRRLSVLMCARAENFSGISDCHAR